LQGEAKTCPKERVENGHVVRESAWVASSEKLFTTGKRQHTSIQFQTEESPGFTQLGFFSYQYTTAFTTTIASVCWVSSAVNIRPPILHIHLPG
jgi:hypothetical protein